VSGSLSSGAAVATKLTEDLEAGQLVDLARSMAQSVLGMLSGRVPEICALATDGELYDALINPTSETTTLAQARLASIISFSPFFRNAFIADKDGNVIAAADQGSAAQIGNVSQTETFQKAIAIPSADGCFVSDVWQNTQHKDRISLMLAGGARHCTDLGGPPAGVTVLELDWGGQINTMLSAAARSSSEAERTRLTLINGDNRIVASSWNAIFGETVRVDLAADQGIVRREDEIIAYAKAPFRNYLNRLGLTCLIEKRRLSKEEIQVSLAKAAKAG
jgi:hypothetical protein